MQTSKDSVEADLNKHFSRYEDPLWDEEEANKINLTRVKRISTKDFKKHCWKIYVNSKLLFSFTNDDISNEHLNFLLKKNGIMFLLNACKNGVDSINKLKKVLDQ